VDARGIAAGLPQVAVGQIVTVKPAHLLTHDNTAAIVGKVDKDLAEHGVIRPDLLVTEHGLSVTELDSVPGASASPDGSTKLTRRWARKSSAGLSTCAEPTTALVIRAISPCWESAACPASAATRIRRRRQ
jgi:hypothetical protein